MNDTAAPQSVPTLEEIRKVLEPFVECYAMLERNGDLPQILWGFPPDKLPFGAGSIGSLLNSESLEAASDLLARLPEQGEIPAPTETCPCCHGKGWRYLQGETITPAAAPQPEAGEPCPTCGGSGNIEWRDPVFGGLRLNICPTCNGTGRSPAPAAPEGLTLRDTAELADAEPAAPAAPVDAVERAKHAVRAVWQDSSFGDHVFPDWKLYEALARAALAAGADQQAEIERLTRGRDALLGSDKWAVLREHVEQARHHARLSHKFMCEAEAAEARVRELEEALEFYADPETYFAIGFFPDNPAGEFTDDFEDVGPELGFKPGKRARAALAALADQPEEIERLRESNAILSKRCRDWIIPLNGVCFMEKACQYGSVLERAEKAEAKLADQQQELYWAKQSAEVLRDRVEKAEAELAALRAKYQPGHTDLMLSPEQIDSALELDTLRATVRELRKLISPLAKEADRYDPPDNDDEQGAWCTSVRIGMLRRARDLWRATAQPSKESGS